MIRNSNIMTYRNIIQIGIDIILIIILICGFICCEYSKNGSYLSLWQIFLAQYKIIFLNILIWEICAFATKLYDVTRLTKYYEIIQKITVQTIVFSLAIIIINFTVNVRLKQETFLLFVLLTFVIMCIVRILYIFIADKYLMRGISNLNVLFVNKNNNTDMLLYFIKKKLNLGLHICGTFLVDEPTDEKNLVFNFNIDDFKNFIRKNNIKIIFLSVSGKLSDEDVEKIKRYVYSKNIKIYFISEHIYDNFSSMELVYFNKQPLLTYKRFPLDFMVNRILKRIFDFIFAFLASVFVLSWLIPLVALAIKLDDGDDVFYIQKRIGFKGRRFNCLKFRTMRKSTQNDILQTQKNDMRITRVGKFLRKTSIDEFPQFLNVLCGKMSVVGPRPHMVFEDEYYKKNIREYYMRHFVPPGITGLAQISGLRGAIECIDEMKNRITADIYYINKWSLMLDIYIIFKTFFKLFKKDEQAF